jgi:hypothetical protein
MRTLISLFNKSYWSKTNVWIVENFVLKFLCRYRQMPAFFIFPDAR